MLRPEHATEKPEPICPTCALPGIHTTSGECLKALRDARTRYEGPVKTKKPEPLTPKWPEIATVREAMRIARVSRRTIHQWMTDGKLRVIRTASGCPRIYVDSLFRP